MRVLIVESNPDRGWVWARHIERSGAIVDRVRGQTEAIEALRGSPIDVIVLNLELHEGSPLAIADFASYRQPSARVIFVTSSTFFSDGSIFRHSSNACAFLQAEAPPEDIAAMVEHYGALS